MGELKFGLVFSVFYVLFAFCWLYNLDPYDWFDALGGLFIVYMVLYAAAKSYHKHPFHLQK